MSRVIDFPTNYEQKINKADELIDKGYIDQAICLIEDFIEQSNPSQGKELLQKKLLTCYFIKKEFDSVEDVLSQMPVGLGDLSILAHRFLLYHFDQNDVLLTELEADCKKNLSVFAYKNLQELIAQLKTFYEEYWGQSIEKQVVRLNEGCSFEQSLLILSDLSQYSNEELGYFKQPLITFYEQAPSPILKTILFELLAKKELNWSLPRANDSGESEGMILTNLQTLMPFNKKLEQVNEIIEQMDLFDEVKVLLSLQVNLFYQFCFPNYETLDLSLVIERLLALIMGENDDFLARDDLSSTNSSIINYTTCKLSQYILSLSSLM